MAFTESSVSDAFPVDPTQKQPAKLLLHVRPGDERRVGVGSDGGWSGKAEEVSTLFLLHPVGIPPIKTTASLSQDSQEVCKNEQPINSLD